MLTFWEETKPSGHASRAAGHIMYDTYLMMKVAIPGDNKSFAEYWAMITYPEGYPHPIHGKTRMNEIAMQRFGEYVNGYISKQGISEALQGTPLEKWPLVNKAQVQMMKHHAILTVEALAGLTDSQKAVLGLDAHLVQKAKDWLESATNSKAAMQAQEQARALQAKLDSMQGQINDLWAALEDLPPATKEQIQAAIKKRKAAA